MLKIGVQSKGILDSELLDLETGFERIKKAGFDCIDLNLDVFLKNSELYQGEMNRFFEQSMEELRQYFTSYQEGAEQYSLSWSQMHAPYPVWVLGREEQNRIMIETVTPKCLAIAGFLGIPYVVIHPLKCSTYKPAGKREGRTWRFLRI